MLNTPVSFFGKETFEAFELHADRFGFTWTIVPGHGVPGHFHQDSDEIFELISGTLTFTLNGQKIVASAGEKVHVPKQAVHSVFNKTKENAVCKVYYTPASDQDKFMRAAQFLVQQDAGMQGKLGLIIRALYMTSKLGFKEFSTPGSAATRIPTNIFFGIVMLSGNLGGWMKQTKAFAGALKSGQV